jgi:hypothetical protein
MSMVNIPGPIVGVWLIWSWYSGPGALLSQEEDGRQEAPGRNGLRPAAAAAAALPSVAVGESEQGEVILSYYSVMTPGFWLISF